MIWILEEYKKDKEEYVVVKLHTSCCKESILFMRTGIDTYFDTRSCEPCNDNWNKLIEQAFLNKEMYGKAHGPC